MKPDKQREPHIYVRDQGDVDFVGDGATNIAIDIDQIEELIAERSRRRADFDYEGADSIKRQLEVIGVTVSDKERCWYVGQRPQRGGKSPEAKGPQLELWFGPLGHDYDQLDSEVELDADEIGLVNELLRDRLKAKLSREFDAADALLDKLSSLGVSIDDRKKQWRVIRAVTWKRIPGDGDDVKPVNEQKIVDLIEERTSAKQMREFDRADAIREQLRRRYSVVVDDKRKTWQVIREYGGFYRTGAPVDKALPRIAGLLKKHARARLRSSAEGKDQVKEIEAKLHLLGVRLNYDTMTWYRPKRPMSARRRAARNAESKKQSDESPA